MKGMKGLAINVCDLTQLSSCDLFVINAMTNDLPHTYKLDNKLIDENYIIFLSENEERLKLFMNCLKRNFQSLE